MNLSQINRLFIIIGVTVLVAAVALIAGWSHIFKSRTVQTPTDPGSKHARIIHQTGTVLTRRADTMGWTSVGENTYLGERDKLKTLDSSTATVEFENGSVIRLKPNSLIVIQQLENKNTKVELVGGKLNAQIEKIGANEMFLIKAKSAQAQVFREEIRVD